MSERTSDFMLRATVRHLLANQGPGNVDGWTVQGFGMMRCYLDPAKRFRLNIWDDRLQVPNVSVIHDHPWHFSSQIIAGRLTNYRYSAGAGVPFNYMKIKTGEGGGPDGEQGVMELTQGRPEHYFAGDMYSQIADEIHMTTYTRGTVTLNDRRFRVGTGEHARVFWPYGEEWVDAEPRKATAGEIILTIDTALARFG